VPPPSARHHPAARGGTCFALAHPASTHVRGSGGLNLPK
jgi:hypothetical protein